MKKQHVFKLNIKERNTTATIETKDRERVKKNRKHIKNTLKLGMKILTIKSIALDWEQFDCEMKLN